MRIRIKKTGEIINEASGFARALIDSGVAEPIEEKAIAASVPIEGETAALKSGDRERTRAKQPPSRKQT